MSGRMKIAAGFVVLIISLIVTYAIPFGDGLIRLTLYDGYQVCTGLGGLLEAFGGIEACGGIQAAFWVLTVIQIAGIASLIWGFRSK